MDHTTLKKRRSQLKIRVEHLHSIFQVWQMFKKWTYLDSMQSET